MIVFLDIPLELPVIDVIPVSVLFALFYQVAPSAGLGREHPSVSSGGRVWKALSGLWVLMLLIVMGGGAFQLAHDYLPKNISNGIDSFGVRADLTLPYPSGGLIHLHGSVVILVFSFLGVYLLNRRTASPANPATAGPAIVAQPLSSTVVSSKGTLISPVVKEEHARYQPKFNPTTIIPGYERPLTEAPVAEVAVAPPPPKPAPVAAPASKAPAPAPAPKAPVAAPAAVAPPPPKPATYVQKPAPRQQAVIMPEPPPTCRLTTPPPIAVVMPRAAPGVGKMHPCYVIGTLKPVKIP